MAKHSHISADTALLDRPIWAALSTRQADLAHSLGSARAYPSDIGPLAAAAGSGRDDLLDFMALIWQRGAPVMTIEAEAPVATRFFVPEQHVPGVQMIADNPQAPSHAYQIDELDPADADQILALAEQTRPGPFEPRTHTLGTFIGIRQNGTLIAMAGQRMRLPGHIEISAVCVTPAYRGKGLGTELVRQMADRIIAQGERPFLHAYASNTNAIALYERLGFRVRAEMQATRWVRNAMVQVD